MMVPGGSVNTAFFGGGVGQLELRAALRLQEAAIAAEIAAQEIQRRSGRARKKAAVINVVELHPRQRAFQRCQLQKLSDAAGRAKIDVRAEQLLGARESVAEDCLQRLDDEAGIRDAELHGIRGGSAAVCRHGYKPLCSLPGPMPRIPAVT